MTERFNELKRLYVLTKVVRLIIQVANTIKWEDRYPSLKEFFRIVCQGETMVVRGRTVDLSDYVMQHLEECRILYPTMHEKFLDVAYYVAEDIHLNE